MTLATVRFRPEVVEPCRADRDQMRGPGPPAERQRERDVGDQRDGRRSRSRRCWETCPGRDRLVRRRARMSSGASIASLAHPTDSCPHSTARASRTVRPPSPAASAVALKKPVTATDGSGWVARTRPTSERDDKQVRR